MGRTKERISNMHNYNDEILEIASWLARGNAFLREEIRVEMQIAILDLDASANKGKCLQVAKRKGLDYLRSKYN